MSTLKIAHILLHSPGPELPYAPRLYDGFGVFKIYLFTAL